MMVCRYGTHPPTRINTMKPLHHLLTLICCLALLGGCASTPEKHQDLCIMGVLGTGAAVGGAVGNGPGMVVGVAGGAVVAHFLCDGEAGPMSLDSDGDGVADAIDECPNTPSGVVVDSSGCPRDDDFDGVANHMDDCPGTPRGVPVDNKGCPRDDDRDGVVNYLDECPGTPAGVAVDTRGCPQAGETLLVLNNINFAFDSSALDAPSRATLDEAAQLLRQQNVRVRVVGHTDSMGSTSYNQSLSERRAAAVVSYLVSRGLDNAMLSSSGEGESRPVASNDTREGRAANRRVEFIVDR